MNEHPPINLRELMAKEKARQEEEIKEEIKKAVTRLRCRTLLSNPETFGISPDKKGEN